MSSNKKNIERSLRKFFGSDKPEPGEGTDELQALLLQISLALLMVFMISTFIFRSTVVLEFQEKLLAKTQIQQEDITKEEAEKINNVTLKLINILNEIDNEMREKLGLNEWTYIKENGELSFFLTNIFNGISIDDDNIKNKLACATQYAKSSIPFQKRLEQEWYETVLQKSGGEFNSIWLRREINKRLNLIHLHTIYFQEAMLKHVNNYYLSNLDQFNDKEIERLVSEYLTVKKNKRERIMLEMRVKIQGYSKKTLGKQGVMLLNEI